MPLPSARHFPDVPGAWVSLGKASSGLSAPVPLGPRLPCGFWVRSALLETLGVAGAGVGVSPAGPLLPQGCVWQVPCQRPGLCQLLSLPPPLWFLTLGPRRL